MRKLLAAFITGLLFVAVPVHADARADAPAEALVVAVYVDFENGGYTAALVAEDGRSWTEPAEDLTAGDLVEVIEDEDGPRFGRVTGWFSIDESGNKETHRRYNTELQAWDGFPEARW